MVDLEDRVLFGDMRSYKGSSIEEELSKHNPSDYVELSEDDIDQLVDFLDKLHITSLQCPSDIFLSCTIPIKDLIIKVCIDDPDLYPSDYFRIVVTETDIYVIYFFRSNETGRTYFEVNPICYESATHESLIVDTSRSWMSEESIKAYNYKFMTLSQKDRDELVLSISMERQTILCIWYAIQILLLNPETKKTDIFTKSNKKKIPDEISGNRNQTKKRRKAKYMKSLRLNTKIFEKKGEYTRHTLCWYVIGHYRHSGNKKIWVNGYWKGPMRHTKKNLDDGRERVLDIPNKGV